MAVQEATLLLWSVSSYFGPVTEERLRIAKGLAFSYNFSRRDCRVGKVMTALEFYGGTLLLLLLSYLAGALGAALWDLGSLEGVRRAVSFPTRASLVERGADLMRDGVVEGVVRQLLSRLEDEATGTVIPDTFVADIPGDRREQAARAAAEEADG